MIKRLLHKNVQQPFCVGRIWNAPLSAEVPLPSSPTAMPPSPRGRLFVVAARFPVHPKGVPLGELDANAVSRLRGCPRSAFPIVTAP